MSKQGNYYLHLGKVLNDKDLPNYIKKTAKDLKGGSYLTSGEFFEKLTKEELIEIDESIQNISTKDFKQFEILNSKAEKDLYNLSLLCFILALGEGESVITPESLEEMLKILISLTAVEILFREDKVEIKRENFSILDGDRTVVRLNKKGDTK